MTPFNFIRKFHGYSLSESVNFPRFLLSSCSPLMTITIVGTPKVLLRHCKVWPSVKSLSRSSRQGVDRTKNTWRNIIIVYPGIWIQVANMNWNKWVLDPISAESIRPYVARSCLGINPEMGGYFYWYDVLYGGPQQIKREKRREEKSKNLRCPLLIIWSFESSGTDQHIAT